MNIKIEKAYKMKVKDWQKATQLVCERQNQAATTDTSELSSFSLSKMPVDQSGPSALIHRPYVPYQLAHQCTDPQIIISPQKPCRRNHLMGDPNVNRNVQYS